MARSVLEICMQCASMKGLIKKGSDNTSPGRGLRLAGDEYIGLGVVRNGGKECTRYLRGGTWTEVTKILSCDLLVGGRMICAA